MSIASRESTERLNREMDEVSRRHTLADCRKMLTASSTRNQEILEKAVEGDASIDSIARCIELLGTIRAVRQTLFKTFDLGSDPLQQILMSSLGSLKEKAEHALMQLDHTEALIEALENPIIVTAEESKSLPKVKGVSALHQNPRRNPLFSILRWLLILPTWLIVLFLGRVLISFVQGEPITFERASALGMVPFSISTAVAYFFATYAGIKMAPSHRKVAAILLMIVICANAFGVIFASVNGLDGHGWKDTVNCIAGFIGASVAAWYIPQDD